MPDFVCIFQDFYVYCVFIYLYSAYISMQQAYERFISEPRLSNPHEALARCEACDRQNLSSYGIMSGAVVRSRRDGTGWGR